MLVSGVRILTFFRVFFGTMSVTVIMTCMRSAVIVSGVFDLGGDIGCGHPRQQEQRQGDAIVIVELNFRQEIGQGDTEQRPRGECQCQGHDRSLMRFKLAQREGKHDGSQGERHGKRQIDELPHSKGPATHGHQAADGHGIEWLVEHNRQECTQSQPATGMH